MLRFLLPLLFLFTRLHAAEPKEYLVFSPLPSGLFSIFTAVVGLLDAYEKKEVAGFHLEFYGGLYQDKPGTSWWDDYCAPLAVGSPQNSPQRRVVSYGEFGIYADHTEHHLSRKEVYRLIQKYIRFHPHITERVEYFVREMFSADRVIGLHYRGTDKGCEAPRVPYERVTEALQKLTVDLADYQIFAATDEQSFLDYIQREFPGRVMAQDMERSRNGRPIHTENRSPSKQGQEAIIDALLLSRCDILVRTSSNLSLWSTYFNPEMPVIPLNSRY